MFYPFTRFFSIARDSLAMYVFHSNEDTDCLSNHVKKPAAALSFVTVQTFSLYF